MLIGDGFATFGGWIDFIVILTIAVYKLKIGSYGIAFISSATLLPGILLASLIGKLVNRLDAMRWLRLSLMARAILTISLGFANTLSVFLLIVIARSVFNSVTIPAITVISTRSILTKELAKYYAMLNTLNSIAKIVAPSIGSIIAAEFSNKYALILSGALTMFGLIVFLLIPDKISTTKPIQSAQFKLSAPTLSNTKESIWYIYRNIIISYFGMVFMVNNQLPLILNLTGMDKSALGFLVSASAIGNFFGAFMSKKVSKKHQLTPLCLAEEISRLCYPSTITMCGFLAIAFYFLISKNIYVGPLIFLFFLIGIFSAKFFIISNIFLATNFDQQLGLFSSRLQAVQNTTMLVAPFCGAFILSYFPPSLLFLVCGTVGIISLRWIKSYTAHLKTAESLDKK